MTTLAGNLAYVSLLSLVPLVAVVFALFAAFPMFSDVSIQLRHFIFANFLPATGDVIQRYIEQFVANSNKMTAVGACGLIVTALLLMYSIDSALNTIWRSKRARPKIYSFAVYWMILTLGPLLAGASLAISSYLLSLRWASDLNTVIDNVLRIFRCCCRGSPSGCCTALFLPSAYLTATRLSARLSPHSCSKQERKVSRFISPCSRHISSFMVCWR
ncbi:tRNA-processing ribonuclease BN [Escherichia coli]|nr:tRNA-processing ribonuclease BN [Escherichia coli]